MIEYDKDAIVPPYITEYLRAKTVHNDEFMHSLEKYAEENSVPIVEPETDDDCEIATLECNEDMVRIARENIKTSGYAGKISVIEADAKDYLSYIDDDEVFDMIFLDGPKAHYIYMLDECVRLLKKGGVLISDNVLYKGLQYR